VTDYKTRCHAISIFSARVLSGKLNTQLNEDEYDLANILYHTGYLEWIEIKPNVFRINGRKVKG
jgi:hypothetical protein